MRRSGVRLLLPAPYKSKGYSEFSCNPFLLFSLCNRCVSKFGQSRSGSSPRSRSSFHCACKPESHQTLLGAGFLAGTVWLLSKTAALAELLTARLTHRLLVGHSGLTQLCRYSPHSIQSGNRLIGMMDVSTKWTARGTGLPSCLISLSDRTRTYYLHSINPV
jgi:hypothetical protein